MTNFVDILWQNGIENSLLQECKYQYLDLENDYNLVGIARKGKFNIFHLNVHSLSAKKSAVSKMPNSLKGLSASFFPGSGH